VIKIFFISYLFFRFFLCPLTTEAMGICPSADGQSELQISEANAGAKPPECTSTSQ